VVFARVRIRVHFCTLDLNSIRVESTLGAGFIFHPWVHQKLEKTRNPKKPGKKHETRKNPKKLETRKKSEKPLKET
jgi:hypothetical protein